MEQSKTPHGQLDNDKSSEDASDKKEIDSVVLAVLARRLFLWQGLLVGLVAIFAVGWIGAERDRANNMNTLIVKLHPDGTHTTQIFDQSAPVGVFENTINSLLRKWVVKRYEEDPDTIESNLSHVIWFLGDQLNNELNAIAPDEVERIKNPNAGDTLKIKVGPLQHFADELLNLEKLTGDDEVKTHIFVEIQRFDKTSNQYKKPLNRTVVLSWRINHEWLNADIYDNVQQYAHAIDINPVALEIIGYQMVDTLGDSTL